MQLYNTMSAEERRQLIAEAGKKRLVISFYKYHQIKNPKAFRDKLFVEWNALDVLGRTYVANEGINGQISIPADAMNAFRDQLYAIDFLNGIRLNVAIEHDNEAFLKLKVKVRDKIVADGLDDNTFDVTSIGTHVNAEKFNELIEDENTILVDMRNHYESEVGHFKNAITPDVDTFRDSLPIIEKQLEANKEDKNLVMYCTGGIRCEKASAYFKHKGFKNVFQLEGGIIEYTNQIKKRGGENKFIGKNFVFDERRGERISNDIIAQCHQCGVPCDDHTNCANQGCHLLFIQCESCKEVTQNCCSDNCKEIIQRSPEEQKVYRKANNEANKIFKKGKSEVLKFKKTGTSEYLG